MFLMFLSRATSGPAAHVRSNTCEPLEVTLSLMIIHDSQSLGKQTLAAPSDCLFRCCLVELFYSLRSGRLL